jgi:hypothetical protein
MVGTHQQIAKRCFFSPIKSSNAETCRKGNRLAIQIDLLIGEVRS